MATSRDKVTYLLQLHRSGIMGDSTLAAGVRILEAPLQQEVPRSNHKENLLNKKDGNITSARHNSFSVNAVSGLRLLLEDDVNNFLASSHTW